MDKLIKDDIFKLPCNQGSTIITGIPLCLLQEVVKKLKIKWIKRQEKYEKDIVAGGRLDYKCVLSGMLEEYVLVFNDIDKAFGEVME